jgi:hypothetical protein
MGMIPVRFTKTRSAILKISLAAKVPATEAFIERSQQAKELPTRAA